MHGLWLSREQTQQIGASAAQAYPTEACGLLFGTANGHVYEVIPVSNIAADPIRHYVMDPAALAQHLPRAEREGLTLLGFYHSHPKGDPIPSPTDLHEATYSDVAYLIVGLRGTLDATPRFAAWRLAWGRAERLPLYLGSSIPDIAPSPTPLSYAQRAALVLTGVLALLIVLAVGISLLPPAPPIPQ